MSQEIERKFLVQALPDDLDPGQAVFIQQGYLMRCEGREARVRQKGKTWLLTVKEGSGLQRREVEIELTEEQGRALWPLTEGRRVVKKRYLYPDQGHVMEIDVFEGAHEPLCLCEVEFDSVDAALAYAPPGFVGQDVTADERYKNASLALHGLPIPQD